MHNFGTHSIFDTNNKEQGVVYHHFEFDCILNLYVLSMHTVVRLRESLLPVNNRTSTSAPHFHLELLFSDIIKYLH